MMTNNNNRMVIVTDTWSLNVHGVHEGSRKIEFIDVTDKNVATFILAEDNSDLFHMRVNPKCLSDVCNVSPNDWQKEVADHILVFFDVIGICKSGETIPLPLKGSLPFLTDSIIKIKPAQVYLDGTICSRGEIHKTLSFFEEKILKKMI